jgi:hypothetical protein
MARFARVGAMLSHVTQKYLISKPTTEQLSPLLPVDDNSKGT